MKIEVNVGEILLKSLKVELENLEKAKDDHEITYFYAASNEVVQIMLFCGLLKHDQFKKLDSMIDDIMNQAYERISS